MSGGSRFLSGVSCSLCWKEFGKILISYDTQATLKVTPALVQMEKVLVMVTLHHPCYDSLSSNDLHEQS